MHRFPHVSLPYSPSNGIVWNSHTFSPVRTSKACTSPGGVYSGGGWKRQSPIAEPTATTSRQTTGGDVIP